MSEIITNPFREGLPSEKLPDPSAIVIFGIRGDLAQRKLFPALMHLSQSGRIPEDCALIGVSRREIGDEKLRRSLFDSAAKYAPEVSQDESFREKCEPRVFSCAEDHERGEAYTRLPELLNRLQKERGTGGNILFYLSVPPTSFEPIVRSLGASRLNQESNGQWRRIIIEKPFGRDLESARELGNTLERVFREDQTYRIDHYMGKETVQNILVLRLANTIIEPLWNNHYIDHVQITAAESLGVEDRAGYYEEAGALRDMIQNHLIQILAMLAMEPPAKLTPEGIRNEKQKVLEAIRPLDRSELDTAIVRAQYGAGTAAGKSGLEYRREKGVNPNSQTETFCAIRVFVDNWRWQGVPFYLRTGKRLPKRITEAAIFFKPVVHRVFAHDIGDLTSPNVLAIRIQPNEGITLKFMAKLPGHATHLRPVDMEFRYGTSFGGRISDAYERLLLDAMLGDPTLFARRDSVEESWKFVTPILEHWSMKTSEPLPQYAAGTWGPPEADLLMEADGRAWREL